MGLRPARCYRSMERPYTRQSARKPKKGYVKGVPAMKIHRFQTGPERDFGVWLKLISKRDVQIRHNALEAARVAALKPLEKYAKDRYFLRVVPYPHHVLRENPIATGAGADRFQTGMRLSFGNPIGTAAQIREGQTIIEVSVPQDAVSIAKKALEIAKKKLPTTCSISIVAASAAQLK